MSVQGAAQEVPAAAGPQLLARPAATPAETAPAARRPRARPYPFRRALGHSLVTHGLCVLALSLQGAGPQVAEGRTTTRVVSTDPTPMAWSAEAWSPPETEPEHALDAAEPPEPEVRPVEPDPDSPWPAPAEPELAEPADPLAALRNLPLESLVLSPTRRANAAGARRDRGAPTELAQAEPPAPSGAPAASGNLRPPSLASTPGLAYPHDARRMGQQGSALLRIHVATDGRVLDVELVESSGHERLDQAALTAVRTWSFHPATRDGVPVADSLLHRVTFRIEEGK